MTLTRFTTAQLMHGRDYSGEECAGWLAQRKWNGWSATWDGERLWTKPSEKCPLGNVIPAPDFFLAGLPDFPLCCELVAGKEGENFTTSLVRQKNNPREWEHAKLYVFDAPLAEFFPDERDNVMSRLMSVPWQSFPHSAEVARTTVVTGRTHLRDMLRAVLEAGGEGLMIQPPENPYVAGRTRRLLKVKRASLHILNSLAQSAPRHA